MTVEVETSNGIKNKLYGALFFLIASFIFSIFTLLVPELRPTSDSPNMWFQRSGSFLVVSSIWAEFIVIRLSVFMNPEEERGIVWDGLPIRLKNIHKFLSGSAIGFAILGTIIWGYGDFIV